MQESVNPSPPPAQKKSIWLILSFILIPILLLCIIALGILSVQTSLTSRSRATMITGATSTIESQVTAIAEAEGTLQAEKAIAAQAQSTLQAQEKLIASFPPGFEMTQIVGPLDGELIHNADNGKIALDCKSVDVTNLVASARFANPYSESVNAFDFGFRINSYYRLIVSSSNKIYLRYVKGSTSDVIKSESVSNLKLDENQTNDIMVVIKNGAVFAYLNGELVLTSYTEDIFSSSGEVCTGTGFFSDHEINGRSTKYSDFTIWSLP